MSGGCGRCVIVWSIDAVVKPPLIQLIGELTRSRHIFAIQDLDLSLVAKNGPIFVSSSRLRSVPSEAQDLLHLQRHAAHVIAVAEGADAWPIQRKSGLILSGVSRLIDSASPGFVGTLKQAIADATTSVSARRLAHKLARDRMQELGIVAASEKMAELFSILERISVLSDLSVLLMGPTGTGKELLARALHRLDPLRGDGPFVAVNCAAIPPDLAESYLFGHRRGAFSGALKDHEGVFLAANRGVLFLDEISELRPNLQAKLLRVLQERRVMQIGSSHEEPADFRLVAATNSDLDQMSTAGSFRLDLLHRLNGLTVTVPALADRPEDIEPLVRHFVRKYGGHTHPVVAPEFITALSSVRLDGNIRQLENVVRSALAQHDGKCPLLLRDVPRYLLMQLDERSDQAGSTPRDPSVRSEQDFIREFLFVSDREGQSGLAQALSRFERALLEQTLNRTAGNQTRAAQILGITARSIYNKIHKYGVPQASANGPDRSSQSM